ncbi:MAG TPA: PqiC family protein [Candidatus Binataceae bacterium]|nr:PqiC family protein [Candidatus Binataceae bacterium]
MKVEIGLAAIVFAIAGCSSILEPRPDPTKFYVLTATSESAAPNAASAKSGGASLGLGPVNLPAYLDRPEVVTRATPNRIELSRVDRWGEPLRENFVQVLSRDLAAKLGTQRIAIYPWYDTTPIDLQVQVDVYHFEADAQGKVQLTAKWTIIDAGGKGALYTDESNITQTAKPGDATDTAAALSRAVNELSGSIATQVTRLRSQ